MSAAPSSSIAVSASARASATLYHNARIYASASEDDLRRPRAWISVAADGTVLEMGPAIEDEKQASAGVDESGSDASSSSSSSSAPSSSLYSSAVDCCGRCVLPGLIDAHIHVLMTGRQAHQIDVRGARSIDEMLQRVKDGVSRSDAQSGLTAQQAAAQGVDSSAAAGKDGSSESASSASSSSLPWAVGSGWEQDELGRLPTRSDLDSVLPHRPCILWRVCSHILVCNSAALQAAGISAETQAPAGGAVDYQRGILKETATLLLAPFIADTHEATLRYLRSGLSVCLQLGLTCVQTNDEGTWQAYQQLADADQLPIRVCLTIQHGEIGLAGRPIAGQRYGHMLSCDRVKLFADGALGAQTAALSRPYVVPPHRCATMHGKMGEHKHEHTHDDQKESSSATPVAATAEASSPADAVSAPASTSADSAAAGANFGILIHTSSALQSKVASARAAGFRLEVHVIGDHAADEALTAFESAGLGPQDRPIMTHCQVLRADLISRMAAIGAIADVQPQFQVTDSKWAQERLPEELLRYSYCWRTLLDSGVHVAGGSDSPIEVANPLWGMHAAIFRPLAQYPSLTEAMTRAADPGASSAAAHAGSAVDADDDASPLPLLTVADQWRPEECLTFAQALRLYTLGAAYACQREAELGALRVGSPADFIILSTDVVRRPAELVRARVEQVYVQGRRRK